jgi:hypothetical protein
MACAAGLARFSCMQTGEFRPSDYRDRLAREASLLVGAALSLAILALAFRLVFLA